MYRGRKEEWEKTNNGKIVKKKKGMKREVNG